MKFDLAVGSREQWEKARRDPCGGRENPGGALRTGECLLLTSIRKN